MLYATVALDLLGNELFRKKKKYRAVICRVSTNEEPTMKQPVPFALRAILSIVLTTFSLQVWGLDCSSFDIVLSTQEQVDNFQATYGGGGVCDTVSGKLHIEGDDIVDLTPLGDVVSVGGLFLLRNPLLTNLDGLDGLSSITHAGSWLSIVANPLLANTDGLASVTSVAGSLFFSSNASLSNVDGLSGLANFAGDLEIGDNPMLADLNGFSGLESVHLEGRLVIFRNDALATLNGLSGIISVGNYYLDQGSGGGLVLAGNVSLKSLDGLSNITSVDGDLRIVGTALHNLNDLSKLTALGLDVKISANTALANCVGISALLDDVDNDDPGPGPGPAGIPDVAGSVYFENNRDGCNNLAEILGMVFADGFETF